MDTNTSAINTTGCPLDIFQPRPYITVGQSFPGATRHPTYWYVRLDEDRQTARYFCFKNFHKTSGDVIRYCRGGNWTGVEPTCVVDAGWERCQLALEIFFSVMVVSVIIMCLDFRQREVRKGRLRVEKVRSAKIKHIRSINDIDSSRIRPFPKIRQNIMKNVPLTTQEDTSSMDIEPFTFNLKQSSQHNKLHNDKSATDKDDEPHVYNIFKSFRPKINI